MNSGFPATTSDSNVPAMAPAYPLAIVGHSLICSATLAAAAPAGRQDISGVSWATSYGGKVAVVRGGELPYNAAGNSPYEKKNRLEDLVTVHDPEMFTTDWSFTDQLRNGIRLQDHVCREKHRDISSVRGVQGH